MKTDKTNRTVSLCELDIEDKRTIRKIIANGGITDDDSMSYTEFNFSKAVLKEQPMVISVPKKQVDELRENYLEYLNSKSTGE